MRGTSNTRRSPGAIGVSIANTSAASISFKVMSPIRWAVTRDAGINSASA